MGAELPEGETLRAPRKRWEPKPESEKTRRRNK
jgi:hypothetical protein